MMIKINLLKHILLLGYVFLLFASEKTFAQDLYLRVSEKDCVSCYDKIFEEVVLSNSEYKILLPANYKGKRFENFNDLYFQNKLLKEKAVFSDTLFKKTGLYLNNLSGIILMKDKEVLSSLSIKDLSYYKELHNLLDDYNRLEVKLNFNDEGVSNRLLKPIDYYEDKIYIVDQLFGKFYNINTKKSIDLNVNKFQPLLEEKLSNEDYKNHKTYLKSNASRTKIATILGVDFDHENSYIQFTLPYAKLVEYEGKKAYMMNNLIFLLIQHKKDTIGLKNFLHNSILIENLDDLNFYPTRKAAVEKNNLYYLNQVMAIQKIQEFPLLSKFIIDKENQTVKFDQYIDEVSNFNFQIDSLFNTQYLNDIVFSNLNGNILLREHPYAVDLNNKNKYELDWDDNLNTYTSFPSTINYEQLQFWEVGKLYVVLVKEKNDYFLKAYSKKWHFKEKIKLPFNSEIVKDIKFSKESIYLFTDDEILSMPNNFENFSQE